MPEPLALLALLVLAIVEITTTRRINKMSTELDALIANEANLETVVAQVAADNAAIHAELTAALANADVGAIQAVADKIAALAKQAGVVSGIDWGDPSKSHSFRDFDHIQGVPIFRQADLSSGCWYPAANYDVLADLRAHGVKVA